MRREKVSQINNYKGLIFSNIELSELKKILKKKRNPLKELKKKSLKEAPLALLPYQTKRAGDTKVLLLNNETIFFIKFISFY